MSLRKFFLPLLGAIVVGGCRAESPSIPESGKKMLDSLVERYRDRVPRGTNIVFAIDPALGEEEFALSGEKCVEIKGGSVRALFFGLGKFLRENSWRGKDAPQRKIRGIYFATHFSNYYDNAPENELRDYIGDLALWGCNGIGVWFDMHHYRGIDDHAAQQKIASLRRIFLAARDCGMHCNLLSLANEAYADSPVEMRADWKGGKNGYRYDLNGHYHVEICPNAPGAMELLMKWRSEVFDAFADCGIDEVTVCPYDQGGCVCKECAPFGANGYWKILPGYVRLAREKFPGCRFHLGTWRFDTFTDGEWADLFRRGAAVGEIASALYIDPADAPKVADGAPAKLPVIGMSEISMEGMLPWGGFGANPQPRRLEKELVSGRKFAGFRPYSEGVYEDMNKVILLSYAWKERPVREIVGDYVAFYFGRENREKLVEATYLSEENLGHRTVVVQGGKRRSAYSAELVDPESPWKLEYENKNLDAARAGKALNLAESCTLTDDAAKSWRWRIFYLRLAIDAKLAEKENIDAELEELYQINRATEKTLPCLTPSAEPRWRKMLSKKITEHI
ncbi:MAG: hypothetical protein MJ016_02805 [Victivallaceae bacterium]|nr:hypothetical protein [Victivallaceae bacterium]